MNQLSWVEADKTREMKIKKLKKGREEEEDEAKRRRGRSNSSSNMRPRRKSIEFWYRHCVSDGSHKFLKTYQVAPILTRSCTVPIQLITRLDLCARPLGHWSNWTGQAGFNNTAKNTSMLKGNQVLWVPISLIGKISYCWIKDLEFNPRLH